MRFVFSEKKAAQAAAHLIKLHGGSLNYTVAIKLLYLADRKALIDSGRPITGDWMVAMPKGPALSITLNLIREPQNGDTGPWFDYIKNSGSYSIALKRDDLEFDELSAYELRVLDEVNAEFGHLLWYQIIDYTHQHLPEWTDPHGSSRLIEPEEILRLASKSQEEIARIAALAHDVWLFSTSQSTDE